MTLHWSNCPAECPVLYHISYIHKLFNVRVEEYASERYVFGFIAVVKMEILRLLSVIFMVIWGTASHRCLAGE